MSNMNSERPRSEYRSAQGDLYTVVETICGSYDDHSADFIAYSSLYTATTGSDLLTAVASARAMPDEGQRKADHSIKRKELDDQRVVCLTYWQQLTSYIRDGFPANLYDDVEQAAGQGYYEIALNGNWDSVRSLMDSANSFILHMTAELTAGGMPVTFATDVTTASTTFATLHNDFLQSEEASKVGTDAKIMANNLIYREVMRICEDGKRIYRNNAAVREEFTFDRVLDLIRNLQSGHGVLGTTTDVSTGLVLGQVHLLLEELQDDGSYTFVADMMSANDGTYKFNGVVDGSYRLTASKVGFASMESSFTVAGGPEVVDFGMVAE
jgi:hypothetical protein